MTPALLRLLADAIADWVGAPRPLSDDVRHHALTLLGDDTYGTLCAALDPDHPDFDSLAEYLLFPDEALHRSVDALLHTDSGTDLRLTEQEVAALATQLQQTAPDACLLLDDGPIRFSVPAYLWPAIMERLRLHVCIPEAITHALSQVHTPHTAAGIRVRLRQCRLALEGPTGTLVHAFLTRYPASGFGYTDAVRLWLHVLSTLPPADDAAACLRNAGDSMQQRYRRLGQGLRQSRDFADKAARFSMELMMMQGAQPAYIHEDEARKEMRLLDRISLAVCGVPASEGDALREADYGSVTPESDMDGVLRTLNLLDR